MATNAAGIEIPAALDPFDPQGDMVELANSLGGLVIIPVPNITARDALVAGLGWTPTANRPLWVRRADAARLEHVEVTVDGSTWASYSPTTRNPFMRDGGGTVDMTAVTGTGTVTIPDVPADFIGLPRVFMICSNLNHGVVFTAQPTSPNTFNFRYSSGASGVTTSFNYLASWWS